MKSGSWIPLLLAATLCASCAVGTATQGPVRSMPAARAALDPEYRIFYDTLAEYGDWVLIEPYGYLFRPRLDFHTWRPYEAGFWAPSDSYGWVWISSEPFGWATYHYGRWFHDELRGWVWKPGSQWGPAWVDWQANDRYVGWTPLGPTGVRSTPASSSYVYASVDQMGTSDLRVFRARELGSEVANVRPVDNTGVVDGVEVPFGPPIERIERLSHRPLPRVRISDVIRERAAGDEPGRAELGDGAPAETPLTLDEARRAGEEATRTARTLRTSRGELPERLQVVRPFVPIQRRPAAIDSSRFRPRR